MKLKSIIAPFCCFIIVPLLCFGAALVIGTVTPIGTFVQSQRLGLSGNRLSPSQFSASVHDRSAIKTQAATSSPQLQIGVTGTIGPYSADSYYVTGLNTAGTVKVNNFA